MFGRTHAAKHRPTTHSCWLVDMLELEFTLMFTLELEFTELVDDEFVSKEIPMVDPPSVLVV